MSKLTTVECNESNGREITDLIVSQQREIDNLKKLLSETLNNRRERSATACLQGVLSGTDVSGFFDDNAKWAIKNADALIAELDKGVASEGGGDDVQA